MPPRPFPIELGIGTDIVHLPRIRQILLRRTSRSQTQGGFLRKFMRRLLTYREQQQFWGRFVNDAHALGPALDDTVRFLAGRFAAKEAAIKAIRGRSLNFMDIQVLRGEAINGRSGIYALILDRTGSPDAPEHSLDQPPTTESDYSHEDPRGQVAKISISHDGEYATAVCLAAEGPIDRDVGGETLARSP